MEEIKDLVEVGIKVESRGHEENLSGEVCIVATGTRHDRNGGGMQVQCGAAGGMSVMGLTHMVESVMEMYIQTLRNDFELSSFEIKHLYNQLTRNALENELGEEDANDEGEQIKAAIAQVISSIASNVSDSEEE